MADDPVLARLRALLVHVAGAHRVPLDVGPETALAAGGLELESAAMLELLMGCEAEFGITFEPSTDFQEDALRTVGTLAASVRRALAASA